MKEIKLSQGQVAWVDNEDFDYLNQWKWYAVFNKNTKSFYARRKGYKNGKETVIYMAREIMKTPKYLVCDHINHDTLNNQKINLRNATKAQNSRNRKGVISGNATGFLGVCKNGNGFIAQINDGKRKKRFPTRKTLEEAVQDRKKAEIIYYKEYRSK